jgi:hypothetical protein
VAMGHEEPNRNMSVDTNPVLNFVLTNLWRC